MKPNSWRRACGRPTALVLLFGNPLENDDEPMGFMGYPYHSDKPMDLDTFKYQEKATHHIIYYIHIKHIHPEVDKLGTFQQSSPK